MADVWSALEIWWATPMTVHAYRKTDLRATTVYSLFQQRPGGQPVILGQYSDPRLAMDSAEGLVKRRLNVSGRASLRLSWLTRGGCFEASHVCSPVLTLSFLVEPWILDSEPGDLSDAS